MVGWKIQYMTIAGELLRQRKAKGITQEELTAQVKVSLRTFQRWESGDNFPYAPQLFKWAALLGVEITSNLAGFGTKGAVQTATAEDQPEAFVPLPDGRSIPVRQVLMPEAAKGETKSSFFPVSVGEDARAARQASRLKRISQNLLQQPQS